MKGSILIFTFACAAHLGAHPSAEHVREGFSHWTASGLLAWAAAFAVAAGVISVLKRLKEN